MTARATSSFREGFFLDALAEVPISTSDPVDLGCDLGNSHTVRVVVVGATVVQAAGAGTDATITLRDTENSDAVFLTITSSDLANVDDNGVYIAHLRGSLLQGIRVIDYAYAAGTANGGTAGAISGFKIYIDSVE